MILKNFQNLIRKSIYYNNKFTIFTGTLDGFNNITVDSEQLKDLSEKAFKEKLTQSLQHYQNEKLPAIWVNLDSTQFKFAQILSDEGLEAHHVQDNTISFVKWLDQNISNKIPEYCTHYIGCGALIVKDNKCLLVQEGYGLRRQLWGVPSGLCDAQERLHETAIRELKEETNLIAQYQDLLYVREVFPAKFKRPDIYYGFLVKLEDWNQEIILDSEELQAYQWLDINDIPEFVKKEEIVGTQVDFLNQVYRLSTQGYKFYEDKLFHESHGERDFRGLWHKYCLYLPNFKKTN